MKTNKIAEKYLWGDVEWEKRTKAIANLIPFQDRGEFDGREFRS